MEILELEFDDGGILRLKKVDGKLSINLQAFYPGGLRKAMSATVMIDEEKTAQIKDWLAACFKEGNNDDLDGR
jgi:hypothetical protein